MADSLLIAISMLLLLGGATCLTLAGLVKLSGHSGLQAPRLGAHAVVIVCGVASLAIDVPLGLAMKATAGDPDVTATAAAALTPGYWLVEAITGSWTVDLAFWQGAAVMTLVLSIAAVLTVIGFAAVIYSQQRALRS